jgi:(R)-2-hydroxyacyl-CoA dehydratese activating ATPase
MIFAGIDVGSRTIKVVLFDAEYNEVIAAAIRDQGVDQAGLTEELFQSTLEGKGLRPRDIKATVATGYGRGAVAFADTTVTEITCHARGARWLVKDARTVIDIGGQDSKVISLTEKGDVRDFAMNDRCAAGTGRFLEIVAARLGIGLDALGSMAGESRKPAALNSTCAVFAETEIIGLLAAGAEPADIAAGVQTALASRVASMAARAIEEPVALTGGVALLGGMVGALEKALGKRVLVAPQPQMAGALGAAVVASSI